MTKPGIFYEMSMAEYLAIPALSAGVVGTMVDACPAAAWYESAFNPARVADHNGASDAGSIAHSVFLEGSRDCCTVIDPADFPTEKGDAPKGWTSKAIKAARDATRAAGKIPVLKSEMAEIEAIAAAARGYVDSLRDTEPAIHAMFEPGGGFSETVIVWKEGDTLCKLRADRIAKDFAVVCDYKSTATSVEPSRWGRTQLVGGRYYISAAWYRRGVRAMTGVDPAYLFLAGELRPPYLHCLVAPDPSLTELGDDKVAVGLRYWQYCERAGKWPGYPPRVAYVEAPGYERMQWDERNGIGADGLPATNAEIWQR